VGCTISTCAIIPACMKRSENGSRTTRQRRSSWRLNPVSRSGTAWRTLRLIHGLPLSQTPPDSTSVLHAEARLRLPRARPAHLARTAGPNTIGVKPSGGAALTCPALRIALQNSRVFGARAECRSVVDFAASLARLALCAPMGGRRRGAASQRFWRLEDRKLSRVGATNSSWQKIEKQV